MKEFSPQSAGGKATALKSRKIALKNYYLNPNYCINCKQVIDVLPHQKACEVRKKSFCSRSCAATFNNKNRPPTTKYNPKHTCLKCGKLVRKTKHCTFNKYCKNCLDEKIFAISLIKKGETNTTRRKIATHARRMLQKSDIPKICSICKYDKHVEACHIKPVKDFPDGTLISIINAINNLRYLYNK